MTIVIAASYLLGEVKRRQLREDANPGEVKRRIRA